MGDGIPTEKLPAEKKSKLKKSFDGLIEGLKFHESWKGAHKSLTLQPLPVSWGVVADTLGSPGAWDPKFPRPELKGKDVDETFTKFAEYLKTVDYEGLGGLHVFITSKTTDGEDLDSRELKLSEMTTFKT